MKQPLNASQQTLFSSSAILSNAPDSDASLAKQKGEINHMNKFKPFHKFQLPLVGLSPEAFLDYIESVIPKDHLCRLVKEVVFSLDTESIEAKYSFKGQNSYHPKLMLSLLFYGYATGTRSSRKLEEKCLSDHIFIYLMQCYSPDFRTISDFRKNNLEDIKQYFIEIVRLISKLGITQVGKIYVDGTKVRANASAKRTKDVECFEKWLTQLEEEMAELLKEAQLIDAKEDEKYKTDDEQELLRKKLSNNEYLKKKIEAAIEQIKVEDKKKVNLTDGDANHMKAGGSKDIRPSYNCQSSVTEEGVIMAAEAVSEANDHNQLQPMIEQSESNSSKEVKEASADSGYGSFENYEYLDEKGIDGYVPDLYFKQYKKGKFKEDRYHYSNFKYDESTDSYTCPEGKRLKYWKTRTNKTQKRQWNHKVYKGVDCGDCASRSLCTKSKVRELLIDMREPLLQEMRNKLTSKEGESKYFKRQYKIEPVFGHLKYNLGYRSFLLRGLEKVNAEFQLMCIGWNLKKALTLGVTPAMI
jgi:transposase